VASLAFLAGFCFGGHELLLKPVARHTLNELSDWSDKDLADNTTDKNFIPNAAWRYPWASGIAPASDDGEQKSSDVEAGPEAALA
jgi:hypothetical protein